MMDPREPLPDNEERARDIADASVVHQLREARQRFLELVADLRPELHRYCARMTGSVTDGEDIVQETLTRAYYAIAEVETMPQLRPWLFHIAHHRALDFLRRYDRRMGRSLDTISETVAEDVPGADDALARDEAVHTALARFLELPPLQRSCVILKDVLDHSAEEIGTLLELSVPAVKAALHRGRVALRASSSPVRALPRPPSPDLARYAALFNARDWDAVGAMLSQDVHLDLVSRAKRTGRGGVGEYFTRYGTSDWRLAPARLDGREVLAGYHVGEGPNRPSYFVELTFEEGRVEVIRDFLFVPYIMADAAIEMASGAPPQ